MLQAMKRTIQTQGGAALLYILFISVIFGIALTFILTTITFGQQNIRRYEKQQQAEYRTEGAFEIALKLMESYVDPGNAANKGIWHFLVNEVSATSQGEPMFTFTIDGEEVEVGLERIGQDGQTIVVRMLDLQRPQLRRILRVAEGAAPGDDGVPRYEDGVPAFEPEDGTIYEEIDGHIVIVTPEQLAEGYFYTSGRLVITKNSDPLHIYKEVYFDADQGIYLGTDLYNYQYQNVTFHTSEGHIYVGEGSEVSTSRDMLLQADIGHIVSENATYVSNSYGSITFDAGNYISLVNVTIQSSRNITLEARHIYLENVTFTSTSNGTIHLNAEQSVTIKGSEIRSSNLIEISGASGTMTIQDSQLISSSNAPITLNAAGDLNISGTTLQSSGFVNLYSGGSIYAQNTRMTSPSWTDITMTAAGGISLVSAELNASRDIFLTVGSPSQVIDINGAYLQDTRDGVVLVAPSGATITGTPVHGCASNGVTQICS